MAEQVTKRARLRKFYRRRAGRLEMSIRVHVDLQYLSSLENGCRNPTIITLYELAQALGISHIELIQPDDLLGP